MPGRISFASISAGIDRQTKEGRVNTRDGIDYDAINAAIAGVMKPLVSIAPNNVGLPLYVYHFTTEISESPIIYAHRNGSGSMIARLADRTGFRLCKFWREPEECNRYPTKFQTSAQEDLFHLITAADTETLTLMPKAVINARDRYVAFREKLLRVQFLRGAEKFRLFYEGEGASISSPEFEGKVWASLEAVTWCDAEIPTFLGQTMIAAAKEELDTAIVDDLADHPLAYMF